MLNKLKSKAGYILILLVTLFLTVAITIYRKEIVGFANYGYIGVFAACFAANSTVFLPAPSSIIVFTFASVYSPFWVAVIGGLGAALGEIVGYIAGYSGRQAVDTSNRGLQLKIWLEKYGVLAVFIFAFLPLPLFDLLGVLAGATKMNFIRFILPTIAGKILKMFFYAYAGAGLILMLTPYIERMLNP